MTWTSAHDIATWGLTVDTCANQTDQIVLDACQNVLTARRKSLDNGGYVYYFDPSTGALYRIDSWNPREGDQLRCAVGDGPAPECNDPHPVYPCGYMP